MTGIETNKVHHEDLRLAHAWRLGEPAADAEFRLAYRTLVRHIVHASMPPAEAIDAETEIWSVLWVKIAQYEGRSSLRTWLNVVVKHWCWDRKARRKLPTVTTAAGDEPGADPLVQVADSSDTTREPMCAELRRQLTQCTELSLDCLTPQERNLLRLRLLHNMPLEQVRHRRDIYADGEPEQPVYGITRRVQRAARRIRDMTFRKLAERGYSMDDCAQLLVECEHITAEVVRKFMLELEHDHLQNTGSDRLTRTDGGN
jgi:DNA-directed RNA polymerase specialized sigma24 family protein